MIYPRPLRLSIFPTSDWGYKWTSMSLTVNLTVTKASCFSVP